MSRRPPINTKPLPLELLEIPPPLTTEGLYYIMVDSVPVVPPGNFRSHFKNVCDVDRVELYEPVKQSCQGWVRVRGFNAFQAAVAHLEKKLFNGRVVKVSGSNKDNRIILKVNPDDFQRAHSRASIVVDRSPASLNVYANNAGGQYPNPNENYTGAGYQPIPTDPYNPANPYGLANQSSPTIQYGSANPYGAANQPSTGNQYGQSQLAQDFAATNITGNSVAAEQYRAPRLFVMIRGIPGTNFARPGLRDLANDIIQKLAPGLEKQVVGYQFHCDGQGIPEGPVSVKFSDAASALQVFEAINEQKFTTQKNKRFRVKAKLSHVGYGEKAYKEAKKAKRQWEMAKAASAATDAAPTAGTSALTANSPTTPYMQDPSQPPAIADGSIKPYKGKEKATGGQRGGSNSRGRKK